MPAGRPSTTEVSRDRGSDISRQRQPIQSTTLAADHHLAGPPVQVTERHGRQLAAPQAQSQQDEDDRMVAPAQRRAPIARGQ